MPVVRAEGTGRLKIGFLARPARAFDLHRPAGLKVDMARPVDRREGLGGDQRARLPVDDVEKAVLRRLHDDFSRRAVDLEIGEDHVLGRGEIPRLAGRRLVMPDIVARIGAKRDD